MPIDDPQAWAQGAQAFKAIFEGLRSAVSMIREARSAGPQPSQRENELIESALQKAETATAIAEAEVAKALGFELCKCRFPPVPMLTVGYNTANATKTTVTGMPVFECPICGYNTAGPYAYQRLA